jgi:membrane-associated phospholipid phosphatase
MKIVGVLRPACAGASTTLLWWSARRARTGTVSRHEERVFRKVNDAPDALYPAVWPVMQMGSLGAVYVAAAGVRREAGTRRAVMVAAVGTAVWGGVKLVKPSIGRGRPGAHLPGVHVRGQPQTGLGYPSGHAAVALTLALLTTREPRRRAAAVVGAGVTGAARMYVGAHLPLDVLGGFAIGLIVDALDHRWFE